MNKDFIGGCFIKLKKFWRWSWRGEYGLKRWSWFSSSIAAGVLFARYVMEVMA